MTATLAEVLIPDEVKSQTLFDYVPLNKMFTAAYCRPFSQKKVDALRRNFDLNAIGVLYLSYRSSEDNYAIIDGHHRKVTAEQEGYTTLPARIYIDLTYEQEASLYVKFATVNKQTALDRFKARIEAKEPKALEIQSIVEEYGSMKIGPNFGSLTGYCQAAYTLEKVYNLHGAQALQEVCTLLRASYQDQQRAWSAPVLEGTAMFWTRYHTHPRLMYKRLVERLQLITPEQLIAKAVSIKATIKQADALSAVGRAIVLQYNAGLRGYQLPDWQAQVIGEPARPKVADTARKKIAKVNNNPARFFNPADDIYTEPTVLEAN